MALSLATLLQAAAAQGLPWQYWLAPEALARVDAGDSVLERSSHCFGGCRYDRDGYSAPGALAINPYPARELYQTGGEVTVFDDVGAGALTRLWLTTGDGHSRCIDPAITVRFYLNGAGTPALAVPLAALFDASTAPFQPPLVADRNASSGGYISHVPIAYAQGLRITFSDVQGLPNPCIAAPSGDPDYQHLLWYQFQYHRLAPGAVTASFAAGDSFAAVAAWLAHRGDDPWAGGLPAQPASTRLAAGDNAVLLQRVGSGWLRGIRLRAPRAAYDSLQLRVRIDGNDAVDLPWSVFFATAASATVAARGTLLGEDADGWLYIWLPMPYRQSLQLSISATAALAAPVTIDSALYLEGSPPVASAATFFASRSQRCGSTDLPLFSRSGAGRIVAVSGAYHADGAADAGYLEGDERIYFDGSAQPHWYGTGVEDFFNGGFYFDGGDSGASAYALALAGASEVDLGGVTRAWRLLPGDGPTWHSAIDFHLEAGAAASQPTATCADVVFYGYARPAADLVRYAGFALNDATAAAQFGYQPPAGAICETLAASFESEPPVPRQALTCRYASGSTTFHVTLHAPGTPLRLRRVLDVRRANAPTTVRLNGVLAGYFAFAAADPLRYWQDQDAPLLDAGPASEFVVEVTPIFDTPGAAGNFSESAYELWGVPPDRAFDDGFDTATAVP